MFRYLFAGVVVASTASSASAQMLTVGDMLPVCESALATRSSEWMQGYCVGTIFGIGSMMVVNCGLMSQVFAVPDHLIMETLPSSNAAVQAFVNWARDNPSQWSAMFPLGVSLALSETWPCPAS